MDPLRIGTRLYNYPQLADNHAYVAAVIQEIFEKDIRRRAINYGPVLENIVYRYALAQGCKVSVGRIGKLECDFILRNPEIGYAYVQVAMTIMADRATEEREYRPFTQLWERTRTTRA